MKHIRQGSPAAVSDEQRLFFRGRAAAFRLNAFQDKNRGEVVACFFPGAAFTDAVSVRYPEVPRREGFFRPGFDFPDDGGRGLFPGGTNAHSRVAISQAAW